MKKKKKSDFEYTLDEVLWAKEAMLDGADPDNIMVPDACPQCGSRDWRHLKTNKYGKERGCTECPSKNDYN